MLSRLAFAGAMHSAGYGPHKTLYSRFVRWSRLGVFSRIFAALVKQAGEPDVVMIDAPHLKAHRTASSLVKRGSTQMYRAHQACPERVEGAG